MFLFFDTCGVHRSLALTKGNFLCSCSMVTTSHSFSEMPRTSPRQLLSIRRRANQQTRLVQLVHAFVFTSFFLPLLPFNIQYPTDQNLDKPLLSRPRSHLINLSLVLVPVLEPSVLLHRWPHRLSLPLRPPLYLPRRLYTQENACGDYEGIRELG